MSKFVVNNFNSNTPTLQCESMTTYHNNGVSITEVKNGMLTNGKVMLPVSGIMKRYKDGRIEVNGEMIDWDSLVKQQQPNGGLKLPEAMINEPDVGPGEKTCIICYERSIKTTITDCGHQIYCVSCTHSTVKQGTLCPICRVPITKIIRIYEIVQ